MITYLKGDAVYPYKGIGYNFILHVCNNEGKWGKGFVKALSERSKKPENRYRYEYRKGSSSSALGGIQIIDVDDIDWVINMIAQKGTISKSNPHPLSLEALDHCLESVASFIDTVRMVSIHMPRIGCGLGGATWDEIEPLIQKHLGKFPVFVYDKE